MFDGVAGGQWQDWLTPEQGALSYLPPSYARQCRLLPLKMDGSRLVCATAEPVDLALMGEVQFRLQRELVLVRVPAQALQTALETHCGRKAVPELNDLVDSVTHRAKKPKKVVDRTKATLEWGSRPTKVVAVTGGKGGVGKTALSCNLAVGFAQRGLRVALIDADFCAPNVHVALGIKPETSLADVVAGRVDTLNALTPGPAGIQVLAGEPGAMECAGLHYSALSDIGAAYGRFGLGFDVVVVDTAAGAHPNNLSMLHMADEVLVVLSPDPTGVNDAFVTVRAAFQARPDHRVSVVANRVQSAKEAHELFGKFLSFLGPVRGTLTFRGWIPDEKTVAKATRACKPFVLSSPRNPASRVVGSLVTAYSTLEMHANAPLGAAGFRAQTG